MKFYDGKEIRIIFLVLATGYLCMVMSCGQENQATQNRRYQANVARRQQLAGQAGDQKIDQQTASSKDGIAIDISKFQLSLSLQANCGNSKNALCQKDMGIQKDLADEVTATDVSWVDTTTDNGYNAFSEVKTLKAPLETILKDAIDSLDKNIDLVATNPHIGLTLVDSSTKTLHCQVSDDRTSSAKEPATDKILILTATNASDSSRTSVYAQAITEAASLVKTTYFSARLDTHKIECQASNAGDLKDAKNLQAYQQLVGQVLTITLNVKSSSDVKATARGPSSVEDSIEKQTFHGKIHGKVWNYKTARVYLSRTEDAPMMVIEIFEQDIAPNQICSTKFQSNMRRISINVPLVADKNKWVAQVQDADISILPQVTDRKPSSSRKQLFWEDLRISQDDLNDGSTNNMNMDLKIKAIGVDTQLEGSLTAEICVK